MNITVTLMEAQQGDMGGSREHLGSILDLSSSGKGC